MAAVKPPPPLYTLCGEIFFKGARCLSLGAVCGVHSVRSISLSASMVAAVALATVVILVYSVVTSSLGALPGLLSADTVFSAALITLGWVVSAVRLKLLLESYGGRVRLPLLDAVAIRLIGGLVANITPSSIGGEPARAYYVSRRTGLGMAESYALVIYEVYYDVIAVNLAGVFLSIQALPLSTPVLLVAVFMSTSWLYASFKVSKTGRSVGDGSSLPRWVPGFLRSRFNALYARYLEFARSYSSVSSSIPLRVKAAAWALTLVYHTIWGLAVVPFTGSATLPLAARAVEAYFLMQSFSSLPTPGGSGAAEYGLSLLLDPSTVVKYRVLYYYYGVVVGLAVLAAYDSLLRRMGKTSG